MKREDNFPWGAKIERGIVTESRTIGGDPRCDVKSVDRPGVTFRELPSPAAYITATAVYFFAFEDGRGRIIGKI